jgi:predicted flap endonuclease-1-like 5' DNA nuclease
MEALAALFGLGVAAAAPFVPGLRPIAKAVVKGGMAVADATVTVAVVVAEEVGDLAAHLREGRAGGASAEEAAAVASAVETAQASATEAPPEAYESATLAGAAAAAPSTPTLRPVTKAAVKGGLAVADAAKAVAGAAVGAAAVAGKQVSTLAANVRSEKTMDEVADSDATAADVSTPADAHVVAAAETPPVVYTLIDVNGVGPKTAALLHEAGIATVAQLAATPVDQLKAILDQAGPRYRVIDPSAWPANAQALLDAPPPQPKPFDDSDLVQIDGIGPKTATLLVDAGITTVSQLAATPVEQLRAVLDQAGSRYRIVDPSAWPAKAQALLPTA